MDASTNGMISNLGYPRIGELLEWKKTLENYWSGTISEEELAFTMRGLRHEQWRKQADAGVGLVPVGDFSFFDHMLDHSFAFGLIPERFSAIARDSGEHELYFAMARGANGVPACDTANWFNTSYRYIVPEWREGFEPKLVRNHWAAQLKEARLALGGGASAKPVVVGPYTFVRLARGYAPDRFGGIVRSFVPVYKQLLSELADAGAEWVQLDEPALVLDNPVEHYPLLKEVYGELRQAAPGLRMLLQTYFEAVDRPDLLFGLPVDGIGLDFVHDCGANLKAVGQLGFPEDKVLAAGIVDGRNVWRTDLSEAWETIGRLLEAVPPERLLLQPSCSLLHVPVSLKHEKKLPQLARLTMAFADEKLRELAVLALGVRDGVKAISLDLADSDAMLQALAACSARSRMPGGLPEALKGRASQRHTPVEVRYAKQREKLKLPLLPTAAVGGLPHWADIRNARLWRSKGEPGGGEYEAFVRGKIKEWVKIQEDIGLDVLVHGEFERDDLTEYFAGKLDGFLLTSGGWVQACGSRCVKPPIIFGDVVHAVPMTLAETVYAQTLTERTVKGMLVGPVTLLNRSFVRTDISSREAAFQVALAIAAEVELLEAAGISAIQIDEPALHEAAPLKRRSREEFLAWGVDVFKLCSSGVKDSTQIHTHITCCNCDEILEAIKAMDADVILLQASRKRSTHIGSLRREPYQGGVGLGAYDIDGPLVPAVSDMEVTIRTLLEAVPAERLWITADCGLPMHGAAEAAESLRRMAEAVKRMRQAHKSVHTSA